MKKLNEAETRVAGIMATRKHTDTKEYTPPTMCSIIPVGEKVWVKDSDTHYAGTDDKIYGIVYGCDLCDSLEDMNSLNYWIIPEGKTFKEVITTHWATVHVVPPIPVLNRKFKDIDLLSFEGVCLAFLIEEVSKISEKSCDDILHTLVQGAIADGYLFNYVDDVEDCE